MIKTYQEAQTYLEQFIPDPRVSQPTMNLDKIRVLCQLLSNPQNKYPIIHVAGTSGKGSTATFASYILKELGLTVGLHLSPHLEKLTERMQINNQLLPEAQFVESLNEITDAIAKTTATCKEPPSYFEILVALSFHVFAKAGVEAAVVEVGLGGRLDATNVIPPSVAIITNISLDHTKVLGNTIAKIASEKMGIIKKGTPAVIAGVTQPQVQTALLEKCRQLDVPLFLLNRDFPLRQEILSLKGDFQMLNFTLATKVTEIFVQNFFPKLLPHLPKAISTAAKSAFIPGRLEIISRRPLIVLDGAHNRAKMSALINSLNRLYPKQKFISVVAVKQGKPAATLIRQLEGISDNFIFTRFTLATDSGIFQASSPQDLMKLTSKKNILIADPQQAITTAIKNSRQTKLPILVTGSLYLVGEIRSIIKKWVINQRRVPNIKP